MRNLKRSKEGRLCRSRVMKTPHFPSVFTVWMVSGSKNRFCLQWIYKNLENRLWRTDGMTSVLRTRQTAQPRVDNRINRSARFFSQFETDVVQLLGFRSKRLMSFMV